MLDLRHTTALILWSALVLGLLWAVGAYFRNDSVPSACHPFRLVLPGPVKRPEVSRVFGRHRTPYAPVWPRFRLLLYD